MQITDGKIGARELLSIVVMVIGIKATDTTPDLLIYHAQNASWLLSLLIGIVMLIPFLLLLKLMRTYHMGLYDLMVKLIGRWGSAVIVGWLCIWLLFSTTINTRSYLDIVNTLFFPQTSLYIMVLLFLFFSWLVAIRGFETIGRMSWLLLSLVVLILVVLLAAIWQDLRFSHLFPIFGPGLGELLKQAPKHSSAFGELLLLSFMFPYVTTYRSFQRGMLIGYGFSVFVIIVLNALYVMVFDYPAVEHIAFPYHQLTRAASFGQQVAHVEAIFLGLWIITAVIHFAVYLYLLAYLFARTFQIHEFEPLILPLTWLCLLLSGFSKNVVQLNLLRNWLISTASVGYILLPFLLWGLKLWRDRST
jgi:spore germination protein (amino acid permease)